MKTSLIDIAEEPSQANASVLDDVQKLEHAVLASPQVSVAHILDTLSTTRRHVTDHFEFEEKERGWMEAVRKREPRLEHAVCSLIEEHRELVKSLNTLVEKANAQAKVEEAFRQRVLQWIQRVREHELRENELLQDVFAENLGAGD
jgi:hypothetical protein